MHEAASCNQGDRSVQCNIALLCGFTPKKSNFVTNVPSGQATKTWRGRQKWKPGVVGFKTWGAWLEAPKIVRTHDWKLSDLKFSTLQPWLGRW